jgi:acetoin utilization deacetylase AcuC-like enzyme
MNAFCIVRPPGHHALANAPMGFCLFNNVAIGAKMAIDELGLDRVLIVDWDVHHGNGTQAMFWEDPQVAFYSIHRYPFYPGSGRHDETGEGRGQGTTLNVPLRFGTSRKDFRHVFAESLAAFADTVKPQLVLISAGFDSHRSDPIGSLGLESEDFAELTRCVMDLAATHADGRIVSVLEGGYNPTALAESVEQHLTTLTWMSV